MIDDSYSPDVEINERGVVVYVRDIKKGEVISIPSHMMGRLIPVKNTLFRTYGSFRGVDEHD